MTDKEDRKGVAIAEKFFNEPCGPFRLKCLLDSYWTKVAREIIIPSMLLIHEALVNKKHDEKNILYWGDADGELYHIKTNNKKRKVVVFTSQTFDYLFVLSPVLMYRRNEDIKTHSLHIRRVWRPVDKDAWELEESRYKNLNAILDNNEEFGSFCDDGSDFPRRPSLAMYRKIDFDFDKHHDNPFVCGDGRDPGYIISLKNEYIETGACDTLLGYNHLEMLTTCNLQCMARDLKVDILCLNGYAGRR